MRRALVPLVSLSTLLAACGGGGGEPSTRIRSDTLTIYSSTPRHGVSAAAGQAAFEGERRALRDAGGRAGGHRIRLVRLSSTRPGHLLWDPDTVKANADRARKDPSAVAYVGELDYGGSAISLPITNRAGLLQVSPGDGLTSLTRTPPGRPRAGPERYYPEDVRTFVRLVPSDLVVADGILSLIEERRRQPVALIHGEGIADRELVAMLVNGMRRRGHEPMLVESVREDDDAAASLVERLVAFRPGTVVQVGPATPAVRAILAALGRRLASVPVFGGAGLAAADALRPPAPREIRALTPILPAVAQPRAGRQLLRSLARERGAPIRAEALYGYESMLLVLAAIERAGADRRGVARAALSPKRRQTVIGPLSLASDGDVRPGRLALMNLSRGRRSFEGVSARPRG